MSFYSVGSSAQPSVTRSHVDGLVKDLIYMQVLQQKMDYYKQIAELYQDDGLRFISFFLPSLYSHDAITYWSAACYAAFFAEIKPNSTIRNEIAFCSEQLQNDKTRAVNHITIWE